MSPRIEQRIIPGSNSRPADLLLPSLHGRGSSCDFAITHPLQPAYVDRVAQGSFSAAEDYALKHKTERYAIAVEAEGYEFAPCVVDTFGNWCEAGRSTLNAVAEASSCRDGRSAATHLRLLLQRCACCLQLANARALLQRDDPTIAMEDCLPDDATFDMEGIYSPTATFTNIKAVGESDAPPT
jgi:hypothetical protein